MPHAAHRSTGKDVSGLRSDHRASAASTIKLPREIADITPAFLAHALAPRFPGIVVRDYTIPFSHHGFSTVLRLDLDLDEASLTAGAPPRIIMKGSFEPETRGIAADIAIAPFLLEMAAYRTLPDFGLNMPACYFAEVDMDETEGPQIILLMEDLAERGIRFGRDLAPHTVEQARRCLTALAAFHARTWDSPGLEQDGRFDIFPHDASTLVRSHLLQAATSETWKAICEAPRGAASAAAFHDRDWLHRAMDFMARLGARTSHCLIHGGLQAGNLFEEADGTPGFLDPAPMRTAPMIEVSCYITNVLDHGDRRRCDRDLVGHYRRELIRHGAAPPSLDALMYQFAAFLPYGFATFMVNAFPSRSEAFAAAHVARYSAAMLDHETRQIIA